MELNPDIISSEGFRVLLMLLEEWTTRMEEPAVPELLVSDAGWYAVMLMALHSINHPVFQSSCQRLSHSLVLLVRQLISKLISHSLFVSAIYKEVPDPCTLMLPPRLLFIPLTLLTPLCILYVVKTCQ